jgi:hypothetical protein
MAKSGARWVISGCLILYAVMSGACGNSGASNAGPDASIGQDSSGDGSSSGAPRADGGGSGTATGSASGSGGDGGAKAAEGGTKSGSSGAGSSGVDGGNMSTSSSGGMSASSSGSASGSSSASTSDSSVLQHHKNATRDGVYVDKAFTAAAMATMHRDTTFSASVNGSMYAQPLYVENGPGGQEAFIIATEANHVAAIGGTGTTLWDHPYGTPVSAGLPCGNVSPLGITGTPVIDTASRSIYFDAMTQGPKHLIHAVSLDDGSEKSGWPVDVSATISGFDSSVQNQRGALLFLNGTVYVPYGGHYGDCGNYHGWVIGVPSGNPSGAIAWHTDQSDGGIWAHGGLSTDGTSIFLATGNTTQPGLIFTPPQSWAGGDAVIRLSQALAFSTQSPPAADYFVPSDWMQLDSNDQDLGGTNPVLFDSGGQHLVAILGKNGYLYVLNRDNLGGVSSATGTLVSNGELMGAPAAYTTSQGTYVAFRANQAAVNCPSGKGSGNLGVAKITGTNPPAATVVWCSTQPTDLGSPMITTTDGTSSVVVWDADNRLYGYDGDTGQLVYDGSKVAADALTAPIQYFNAAIAAKGRIVVGDQAGNLSVFKP